MSFALPTDDVRISTRLRELEQSAPKPTPKAIKAAMVEAADRLEGYERHFQDWILELQLAASLKVGQMDSQSKSDEIHRQVNLTLRSVADQMAALL